METIQKNASAINKFQDTHAQHGMKFDISAGSPSMQNEIIMKKGTTLTSNPLKESLKSNTMKYVCKFRDDNCI